MSEEREALIDLIEAVLWDYAASSGGNPKYRRVHGAYRLDGSPTACAQACELLVAEGRAKVFQQDPTMISIIKPDQPTQAEVIAELQRKAR